MRWKYRGFKNVWRLTDVHTDGWGIAFFEGQGVRQFLDPEPSYKSPIAEFVRGYPIKSKNVIATTPLTDDEAWNPLTPG